MKYLVLGLVLSASDMLERVLTRITRPLSSFEHKVRSLRDATALELHESILPSVPKAGRLSRARHRTSTVEAASTSTATAAPARGKPQAVALSSDLLSETGSGLERP